MRPPVRPAEDDVPAFTGEDIVRLFAATYLPLCRTLEEAGALDPRALARDIAARVGPDADQPWAILAAALCKVLDGSGWPGAAGPEAAGFSPPPD